MSRRRSTVFLAAFLLILVAQNFEAFVPSAFGQDATAGSDNSEQLSPTNQKRLQSLEQAFFFKLFAKDPVSDRLQRLEKQVFGVTMNGTTDHRLETLENSLAESDPGTGKPLAPRDRPVKKVSAPAAPPEAASASQSGQTVAPPEAASATPAGQTVAPPMTPVLTKAAVPATPDPPAQDTDNTVLHISKERFAIDEKPESYIRQVTEAMRTNPQEFTLAFERAKAEIQLSKWDRALSDLCDAISSIPSNAEFYLARAFVYTRMGNSVLAREDLRQARFHNTKLPKNIDFEEHGLASKK